MVSQLKTPRANADNAPEVINGISRELTAIISELNAQPFATSRIVQASLTTTPQAVPHNLGRTYRGVLVIKKTASLDVYDGQSSTVINPDETRFAMLRVASGSGTVTLLFF